jgi:PAS domain S-box-containing protein
MLLSRVNKPVIVAAWAVIFVAGVTAGWLGYRHTREHLVAGLIDDANRCAAAFDPDNVRQLAGTRDDLTTPVYAAAKRRLQRLRALSPHVRFVYIFRFLPEADKVICLADSVAPGAPDESHPGDDYPQATQSPGLQEIIRTGQPVTEGPLADALGVSVTGYALIGETPSTKPDLLRRDLVALNLDGADWRRELWMAVLLRATTTWALLGLPLLALLVLRRQLEQREAIRNLSAAMEQSHSALMIIDLGNRIEYANTGLCQQIGYTRRELIGRHWGDFHVTEEGGTAFTDLVATVRSGHPWEGEWFNRRKNGEVYPVRGVVTPVKSRDGSLACFIAVFEDATDTRRREAELRDARDLAQAGDRAKGQFLATMSHEIRTPLNGIVGFTNLLLGTSLTPEQRDFVETIHASGEALIQLTGDILDYARIESGKLKLEALPCDPRECVEEALDLFATRAAEKRIELLHTVAADVPATIIVDGGRLRQVLTNLINNAVKFTTAGEIAVSVALARDAEVGGGRQEADGQMILPAALPCTMAETTSATLLFSVRDTGIGIPADQRAQLFRPFNQLDSTSTRKFGGAGLGLAICRNLVHLLGGEISFTSEPGLGSTFAFTIRVPVASPPPTVPDLGGLRLALVAPPGPLRRELAELGTRWRAQVIEVDEPAALKDVAWETALVEIDEARARSLTAPGAPPTGLPQRRATALVPLTLSTEMRAALRVHFHLLLNKPVHRAALFAWLAGVRPVAPLAAPPPTHFGLRVLVVEDNQINQRLMQRILTNLGCKWTVAENGRRAMEALTQPEAAFDVILLDLHMPELDGAETLKKIRAGECGLRVQSIWIAALTADVRQEQRARVLAAGANDFLTKPLQLPELEAAFRRYRAERGEKG